MFCPLLAIALQGLSEQHVLTAQCQGPECAWWYTRTASCSVTALTHALDHMDDVFRAKAERG